MKVKTKVEAKGKKNMDFTDDPALRIHLQSVYDGIYDTHVRRNLDSHQTLQSEELASFLDEYALCSQECVPLPAFRCDSYEFNFNDLVRCASFHEGTLALQVWGERHLTYFDLETFLPSERLYSNRDNDAFINNVLQWDVVYEYPRERKMDLKNIGGFRFFVDDEEKKCYFDEATEEDNAFFYLDGHLYQACASDSFLHFASGVHFEHNIPGYPIESCALCAFRFRDILHVVYENGLIVRYFFHANLPAPFPALPKEKAMAYLHESVEKRCQGDLYKLEDKFRALGDYHVRFGIRIPTPVRGLHVRNMGSFNIAPCREELVTTYMEYEDSILRYHCLDQKVRTWNLRTDEKKVEDTLLENLGYRSFHADDKGVVVFEKGRYYCKRSRTTFYTVLCMQRGEEKAAYVIPSKDVIATHSAFLFHGEWYGFRDDGISHIASNTLVSDIPRSLTCVTTILVDDVLYVLNSSGCTNYQLSVVK